jgi:FkbM family methyltransferase
MFLLRNLYYLFETFFLLFLCLKEKNQFLILTPRLLSLLVKRVIIFDIKKKKFFFQHVRNYYDINTVFQIFGYEEYNLSHLGLWNKILKDYKKIKQKKIIIDCGSNIGSSSRYFSEIFKDAKIISIEPDYSNFLISEKNINKLSTNNINSAIASKNYNYKIIKYSDPRAYQVKIKKNNRDHKNLKKTLKINEILKKEKQNSPFIIKIDIEGFEKELFESNFQWMDKFKIIIIEIHDWMTPSQSLSENYIIALSKTLKKNKRDLIILGENLVSIRIN